MAITIPKNDGHDWTVGGILLSFIIGVTVVASLWLFSGLLIGLFFI